MLRQSAGSGPDVRLVAGALACAAVTSGLAAFGDVRAGNYLPGLLGWLLVARLLQRATYALVHQQGAAPDDWIIPAAGTAWMFLFILFNDAEGFYWCIPVLVVIALHAPSPVVGPAAGAAACLAALATYPVSGIEVAGTASLLLACTAAISSFAAGWSIRKDRSQMVDALTLWGSAATVYWESDGSSTHYSSSFKSMLGYSADKDHTPFNFFDLVHPDDRAGLERIFRAELRMARMGRPLTGRAAQVRLMARDGTWRWVLADIVALFVSRSAVSQCICSFVDITSHVVAQDALAATRRTLQAQSVELLEVRERLRNSELARRELYKLVPLAWEGPAGAADDVLAALEEGDATGAAAPAIALARSHLEEASRRTKWVIQLALMEQGQWHPQRKAFDVVAMAAAACAAVRPAAQARGLGIELARHGRSMLALGDEDHCRVALEALMRETVQIGTAGSVLAVSATERAGRVGVELWHTDTLPATRRATYFDRRPPSGGFPQVSPHAARMIVRAQGGDVVLGPPSRKGTHLLFMLEQASVSGVPSPRGVALDVLVTGGRACRQSVMKACAGLPVEIRQAPDGPAAIDAVILRRPDVVVADATDGLDGFADSFVAIRTMQRDAAEPASLWIAMGVLDGAQAADFDHCLPDPATWQGLSGLLQAVLADKQAEVSTVHVDPSLLKAVPQYAASRKRLAAELREALQAGHRVEAARIAHLLGGSPGLRGFEQAVLACRAIGDLDSNEPLESLLSHMAEVDAVLERLET